MLQETRFYREIIQMCRAKGYANPQASNNRDTCWAIFYLTSTSHTLSHTVYKPATNTDAKERLRPGGCVSGEYMLPNVQFCSWRKGTVTVGRVEIKRHPLDNFQVWNPYTRRLPGFLEKSLPRGPSNIPAYPSRGNRRIGRTSSSHWQLRPHGPSQLMRTCLTCSHGGAMGSLSWSCRQRGLPNRPVTKRAKWLALAAIRCRPCGLSNPHCIRRYDLIRVSESHFF